MRKCVLTLALVGLLALPVYAQFGFGGRGGTGMLLTNKSVQEELKLTDAQKSDVKKIQELLDPNVLVMVGINPESRVKVTRGPAEATLQQNGYTVVVVKVVNDGTVKKGLHIHSPQSARN